MKTTVNIKTIFGEILFSYEAENNTMAKTLTEYIRVEREERGKFWADLRNSDLSGSDLRNSDLSGSDLSGSDLRNSDLRNSNLRNSDLRNSNLSGSDLSGSDLRNSDLRNSDLTSIKADFFLILLQNKGEVKGLKKAVIEGQIDGSSYSGSCACLVGTIANIKHCSYAALELTKPDSSRPAEKWFLGIKPGDTPENHQMSKITLDWIEEFEYLMKRK